MSPGSLSLSLSFSQDDVWAVCHLFAHAHMRVFEGVGGSRLITGIETQRTLTRAGTCLEDHIASHHG